MSKWTTSALSVVSSAMRTDQRGGVAIIFALVLPVIAFFSLVVLDYSRLSTAKQVLQDNLDAATLIAARSSAIDPSEIDRIGEKALLATIPANSTLMGLTPGADGRLATVNFVPSGTVVKATADISYKPLFRLEALFNSPATTGIPVKVTSEVVRSMTRLEIAMVLDTTGSMQGSKITNLKTAATNFVTTMEGAHNRSLLPASTPAVRISVVPFSNTVKVSAPISLSSYNLATNNRSGVPTWLDGSASAFTLSSDIFSGSARTDRFKMLKQMGVSWAGCVEARKAPYDIQETAPSTGSPDTLFTPYFWPDEPDVGSNYVNSYLVDGGSSSLTWKDRERRPEKYVVAPTPGNFQGTGANTKGPNAGCAMQKLQPLTTNFQSLRDAIDDLVPNGETNIPLGLMWGWHSISPNLPFANGSSYTTANLTKVIVLMTDGDNTMSDPGNENRSLYHGYGYIWQNRLGTTSNSTSTRTSKMNGRLAALCTNIKNAKIVIYTVGVGVSANAKAALQSCTAQSGGAYYDVNASGSNLDAAFSAIAGSIENLRISK